MKHPLANALLIQARRIFPKNITIVYSTRQRVDYDQKIAD
jgi:hypothetical protein